MRTGELCVAEFVLQAAGISTVFLGWVVTVDVIIVFVTGKDVVDIGWGRAQAFTAVFWKRHDYLDVRMMN